MTDLRTLAPPFLQFVLLSFEGPDLYAQAGGLGTRMTGLGRALARRGHPTHHIYVGDPSLPDKETASPNLILFRLCSEAVGDRSADVYEGEQEKLACLEEKVPELVVSQIIAPAADRGIATVLLAEEWHTANLTILISRLLQERGLRDRVAILWNANNTFGFDGIEWGELTAEAMPTTVSRYMKHLMWREGVNPLVVPNGLPRERIGAAPSSRVVGLRKALARNELLLKIGRWTPDKRWEMAVKALAEERKRGVSAAMVVRGGTEPYGEQVLTEAARQGLEVADLELPEGVDASIAALQTAARADIYNIQTHLSTDLLRVLYTAADAVLANSGHEPFGLVGLEAMAAGGVAVVGSTGEDYALAGVNSLVLDTDEPREICALLERLRSRPQESSRIRKNAQDTARRFTWDSIVDNVLLDKLSYTAGLQGVDLSLRRTGRIA